MVRERLFPTKQSVYESLLFFVWGVTFINGIIEYQTALPLVGSISTPLSLFVVAFATLSLTRRNAESSTISTCFKIKLANDAR